ncbi:BREX-1 system adenine-specific DNA-methyltransferase PglX [Massilia sp. DWR3-1-1]|uniref:BREX-1 system adenine-specific DNA-methyltransferase PglX n=1 Tax=Massilia sp. DWR3-1-1 TaxID=2804559 RepID=UPI003CF2D44A
MNKAKLKSYAPQARKDFIAAVTARANLLGLSEKAGKLDVAASQPQGDATVIAGQAWPVKVHSQRQQLIARIQKDGFAQTMEAVAYTWFNRFAALRYMELHDYLGHGHRALSSLEGTLSDILTHAADLAQGGDGGLPGLKPSLVVEMKLAGNRDGELYRLLLVAQCNALSNTMPFLFERIDDETELLLPDNLLRTDSVIAKLVASIEEEDWKEVEIIGWLYQFYISEKKDEVIGKVVKSEDIPAATQLFTPNWIVQYLVQNSVGRLWLMANPTSSLKAEWPYYVEPASQAPDVQAQLDALAKSRMDEDGGTLNPETITLLDPACGSGHILVEAYEVLKSLYLERGYLPRAIPRLILEKNLYGIDIDDRAAQMAGFALLMKARADDRRLFDEPVRLNVIAMQEGKGLNLNEISAHLESSGITRTTIACLLDTFYQAKTFGSLIKIPKSLSLQLANLGGQLQAAVSDADMYTKAAAEDLLPLVAQAKLMDMQFDSVVANPPYMGSNGMNFALREYAKSIYPDTKSDLFSMFLERGFSWCKPSGFNSMVTMQTWMFLSSFATMRKKLLRDRTISTMVQIGYNSFPEINSKIAQACAFCIICKPIRGVIGRYLNLNSASQSADKNMVFLKRGTGLIHDVCQEEFDRIPGSPIAYWAGEKVRLAFDSAGNFGNFFSIKAGISTGKNEKFIFYWHEIDVNLIKSELDCDYRYVPHDKGGDFRKWVGNLDWVLKYSPAHIEEMSKNNGFRHDGKEYYFMSHVGWSKITSSLPSFRIYPPGFTFDSAGLAMFEKNASTDRRFAIGFLNSKVASFIFNLLNPTLNLTPEIVKQMPRMVPDGFNFEKIDELCEISRGDWTSLETARGFSAARMSTVGRYRFMREAWEDLARKDLEKIGRMKDLEEQNNGFFIKAYGLEGELTAEVLESQITLSRADREKESQRLISYAIGCMMGRYSLDASGLIYAGSGNIGFDTSRYVSFPADSDGIVPLTDELWFEDEAASRISEFLLAVWGGDTLAENLAWLAESVGTKAGETPNETIRRYVADKFYKDHLQTYKKRPIYWLFSSGKQGAFQALVYLHRYHEGTLSRMRAEYVVPLTGKIQSRINMLEKDAVAASSTAARNKLAKEVEKLKRKHVELLAYDEELRHHADMRITLDLDDGVKVNYSKFGDLLAEVKAVTGGVSDD